MRLLHSVIVALLFLMVPAVAMAAPTQDVPTCEKGVTNPDGSTRTYRDYALCMAAELDEAQEAYDSGDTQKALDEVGEAYFGWYENNLEPASMTLAGNRKVKMEGRFTRLKIAIGGAAPAEEVHQDIETLKIAVARDAMALDGIIGDDAPESAGRDLFDGDAAQVETDQSTMRWVDFSTAFALLLREGLEALLVVAAIVVYLVRSGNKHLLKSVAVGVGAAVALSFVLAWVMHFFTGGASKASELFEGFTMFLAVGMLFYVAKWMLARASREKWDNYVAGVVDTRVSKGAAKALIFTVFITVIREGAELVLFYTAAFASGGHDRTAIAGGFLAACAVLAVIYVLFRFGGSKLPVGPIFYSTAILLLAMCLSFVGKGVAELKEGDFILGDTNLPWMSHYLPELGIYPWAETLLPQLILLVAAVWMVAAHAINNRKSQPKLVPAEKENPPHEDH
ncbi:FTR1 family iron permease [Corynebacterium sp. TAE3-ERU12]|uniref:FTR1 family iron permease n=1 Tax=Corynebacterium sp. TAE3-ERU12 TaxID=2849491 RepID=UPI001C467111|nr:FTR1 family protein [Corynebacterium sp. TAE3-ERU12]MBV7295874.1 FTR1 family iron permease [Corynebacterium sp. TAE3-ERU12]